MSESSQNGASIALLIDADNSPAAKIDFIISELASYGVVNVRRAYGNWKKRGLAGWEAVLSQYAIVPVQNFDIVKGKNATDISLVIDAMDILYAQKADVYCIVTSDCDFAPLAIRLRADGKRVIGFGGRKTPEPLVDSCSRFLFLDEDEEAQRERMRQASDPATLKKDKALMKLLRSAVDAVEDEEGWAELGLVGSHISNQGPFDQRNYGFAKLSSLFDAIDTFEVKKIGGQLCVRRVKSRWGR